jgi:monoamine oxidase
MSRDQDHERTDRERRRFLKQSAASVAGALLVGAGRGSADSSAQTLEPDVIVVGGGFAGLAAARDLSHDGYRVLLLEARNRLGGRTFSTTFEEHPIEAGGTWIHWSQPFVWAEKERYGLEVEETVGAAPDRMILFDGEKSVELDEEQLGRIAEAFATYASVTRQVIERPYDVKHQWAQALAAEKISAKEHLESLGLDPLPRMALDGLLSSLAHNSLAEMTHFDACRNMALGANEFGYFMDAIGRYKLRDGTASLVEAMLADADLQVKLSTPVRSVKTAGEGVRIETARGEVLRARAAVAALPMNLLGDVAFDPALPPGVVAAARERHIGDGFKLYIKARGRLGRVMALSPSGLPINTVFTYHEADDHTLLVAFGPNAERSGLDVYDDQAVQAELRKLLPGVEVESSFSYDWNLDPFSKGTWANYRSGWLAKYHDDFGRDVGRVCFATGDHGPGWRGFIDGAIGSGIRAAGRVQRLLGR